MHKLSFKNFRRINGYQADDFRVQPASLANQSLVRITGRIVASPVPFCNHCNIRLEVRTAILLEAPTMSHNR